MTRKTPIPITLSADEVAVLLQVCEQGRAMHPVDADHIAKILRDAVAAVRR